MGYKVEERPINIHEIIDAYKSGVQVEAFGSRYCSYDFPIKELKYKDFVMHFDVENGKLLQRSKTTMTEIREGLREDKYNWMWKV